MAKPLHCDNQVTHSSPIAMASSHSDAKKIWNHAAFTSRIIAWRYPSVGDYIPIQMGVSENSVPLNPMVNDHYPY